MNYREGGLKEKLGERSDPSVLRAAADWYVNCQWRVRSNRLSQKKGLNCLSYNALTVFRVLEDEELNCYEKGFIAVVFNGRQWSNLIGQ